MEEEPKLIKTTILRNYNRLSAWKICLWT